MDQELFNKISAAGLPSDLKVALLDLLRASEALLPSLTKRNRRRYGYMLDRLFAEALDPETDTHWWEVTLDLVGRSASEVGETGEAFLQASRQLVPLLRAQSGPYETVTLQEINEDSVIGICLLSDTLVEPQASFVAPNAYSLAQAHFNPHAWFRAIYAGKAPVGFLMIVDDDQEPDYFLWRFMIARPYQGRGYGREAIQRLVEYVRTRPGAKELNVSCGQGEGSPEGFYVRQGFVHTGEKLGDEIVLKLVLE